MVTANKESSKHMHSAISTFPPPDNKKTHLYMSVYTLMHYYIKCCQNMKSMSTATMLLNPTDVFYSDIDFCQLTDTDAS